MVEGRHELPLELRIPAGGWIVVNEYWCPRCATTHTTRTGERQVVSPSRPCPRDFGGGKPCGGLARLRSIAYEEKR